MRCVSLLAPVLYLTASVLFAQSVTVDVEFAGRAKQLLESPHLSDRAWGSRLVGGLHLVSLGDLLIAELRASQRFRDASTDGPEYAYIQSLFDALIDLDVEVPADTIIPYRSRWRTEVIILLSRGRGNELTLLELQTEDLDDVKWLAVSNILLQRRSKKLFERMIEGLPITHHFTVLDRNDRFGRVSGIGDGVPINYPRRKFPEAFPPISLYGLTLQPGNGSVVADGPRTVFFRRVVVPAHGSVAWPYEVSSAAKTSRIDYRLEYLARLGERSIEEVRRTFQSTTTLEWRGAPDLMREIEKKLDEQVFDVRQFVIGSKLRRATDVSFLHLEIKPTITDMRRGRNGLLAQPKRREISLDLQ